MKRPDTRPRIGSGAYSDKDRRRAERKFSRVIEALFRDPGITIGDKRGFGSDALKVNGKIFAMISSKGEFVVKLPKARVDGLVTSGNGSRFEPRPGRLMKEWVVVSTEGVDWIQIAEEACDFVKRGKIFVAKNVRPSASRTS